MKIAEVLQEQKSVPAPVIKQEVEIASEQIDYEKLYLARWAWDNKALEKAVDGIVLLGMMGDPRRLQIPVHVITGKEVKNRTSYNKMGGIVFSNDPKRAGLEGWYLYKKDASIDFDESQIYINSNDYAMDLMDFDTKLQRKGRRASTILHEYRHRGFKIAADLGILKAFPLDVEHAMIYAQEYDYKLLPPYSDRLIFTKFTHGGKEYTEETTPSATEKWLEVRMLGEQPEAWVKYYEVQEKKVYKWIKSHPVPSDLPSNLQDTIKKIYGVRVGTIQDAPENKEMYA